MSTSMRKPVAYDAIKEWAAGFGIGIGTAGLLLLLFLVYVKNAHGEIQKSLFESATSARIIKCQRNLILEEEHL